MNLRLASRLRLAFLAIALAAVCAGPAAAEPVKPPERTEQRPKRLEGVDVDEKPGAPVPLDLGFKDEDGQPVTLRDYVDGKVPVIITLNYSRCPMLCGLELPALVEGMKKLAWTPGKEFRILTVSLDPSETPDIAHKSKNRYLSQYGRPGAEPGWHFLTGSEANIRALAGAVGFEYNYNEARNEYAHPASIVFLTPNGKIARYLYGIQYDPKTLRLTLTEASEGKVGTTVDRLVLYCFHYDENEGRYAPVARNIMKLGGAIALVLFGGLLGALWLTEYRKNKKERAHAAPHAPEPQKPT
jgi:protein SCO1